MFQSFEDPNSLILLHSKKLTKKKLNELSDILENFVANLTEEDLSDGSLVALSLKKDQNGVQITKNSLGSLPLPLPTQSQPKELNISDLENNFPSQEHPHPELEFPDPVKKIKGPLFKENEKTHFNQSFSQAKSQDKMNGYKEVKDGWKISSRRYPRNSLPVNFPSSSKNQYDEKNSSNYSHPLNKPSFPMIREEDYSQQVNLENISQKRKSLQSTSQSFPKFATQLIPNVLTNFDINSVKPGLLSKKLEQALGMKSEKDVPPYLCNLAKVGIPHYYQNDIFYGINTKVPNDYDKKSWMEAGVKACFLGGYVKEVNIIQGGENNTTSYHSREPITDQEYLGKFLRKPQVYHMKINQSTQPNESTIEID